MTSNQMLKVYAETISDPDILDKNDPRRPAVVFEMKAVLGPSRSKAKAAVEWWGWRSPQQMWVWIYKARRLAGIISPNRWKKD